MALEYHSAVNRFFLPPISTQPRGSCMLDVLAVRNLDENGNDEIKHIKQKIAASKCQVDRNYQVKENQKIWAECQEEERQQHNVVGAEFSRACEFERFKKEWRKLQARKTDNLNFENAKQDARDKRAQTEKIKSQEKEHIQSVMERLKLDERAAREKRKRMEMEMLNENQQIIAEAKQAELRKLEEEKMMAQQNYEYNLKKRQQDAEFKQQRAFNNRRDMGVSDLFAQIQLENLLKLEQEETRRQKVQQFKEHERNKMKVELAEKKARNDAIFRAGQAQQLKDNKLYRSMQAQREREELEKVLTLQRQRFNKQREKEMRRHEEAINYSHFLKAQMQQKNLADKSHRKQQLRETHDLLDKHHRYNSHLKDLKEENLKELFSVRLQLAKQDKKLLPQRKKLPFNRIRSPITPTAVLLPTFSTSLPPMSVRLATKRGHCCCHTHDGDSYSSHNATPRTHMGCEFI